MIKFFAGAFTMLLGVWIARFSYWGIVLIAAGAYSAFSEAKD